MKKGKRNSGFGKKHPTEEERERIIKSYRKGMPASKLADLFGFQRETIHRWDRKERSNGSLKRKNLPGSGRFSKIGGNSSKRLIKMLKKPATKFGFETDLWDTKRIQIMCKKELGIDISHVSVWNFLKNIDFSCKKVQKSYIEADKQKVSDWISNEVRRIKRQVRKHKAILYFEDESCISLSPTMGTSWSPKGEPVKAKVTGKRGSVSAISAISNDGRLIFSVHNSGKRFNSDDIIIFFDKILTHHPRRHLVIVMDRAPCHVSKKTCEYIDSQRRLHVFYLPPYSPELNPDEKVWSHLKGIELKGHVEQDCSGLKKLVRSKLRAISNSPETIFAIFKRCEYAPIYSL